MDRFAALVDQLSHSNREDQQSLCTEDACGIVGYVGPNVAHPFLIEGLRILENRGYDSAGIATIDEPSESLVVTKLASSSTTSDAIEVLSRKAPEIHREHKIGIAHTRWATHGPRTDINAHPHVDMHGRIALIHNGIIENSNELKAELIKKGVHFHSETDTEVVVQLIGDFVAGGMDTFEAVKVTTKMLRGTWGFLILDCKHPDRLIVAKNGSPILVGLGQDSMYVASEATAFSKYTKEFISLDDGEVAVIKASDHTLDVSRVELAHSEVIESSPSPFPHWTIKEIFDQPLAVSSSLSYGGRIASDSSVKLGGLEQSDHVLRIQNLIIAACGTSLHAAMYAVHLMRWLRAFESVHELDAAEVTRDSFSLGRPGLLVISQSGETKDVHRALVLAEELNVPIFSAVNTVRSLIARTTKCGVYLNAGRENAVAATKSFMCQVTVLALIAIWFSQHRYEEGIERRRLLIDALHRLSTNIGMTIHQTRPLCKKAAEYLRSQQHLFILGKGLSESIAKEGALKIKEIAYMHAEGYAGGALKHGPFALIEPGTPIILIILNDLHSNLMLTNLEEVKARGAFVIVISDLKPHKLADITIRIPSNGQLTSLLAVVPLQLIAYELSVSKGINPDKPRNLAKAVTVD